MTQRRSPFASWGATFPPGAIFSPPRGRYAFSFQMRPSNTIFNAVCQLSVPLAFPGSNATFSCTRYSLLGSQLITTAKRKRSSVVGAMLPSLTSIPADATFYDDAFHLSAVRAAEKLRDPSLQASIQILIRIWEFWIDGRRSVHRLTQRTARKSLKKRSLER